MVSPRRDYTIYADIGSTTTALTRTLDVLETEPGPNFICRPELTAEDTYQIKVESLPDIWDAKRNPIRSLGTISLVVQLGGHVSRAEFIVCETLEVPVVRGCDYCNKCVEALRPRMKEVELDNGVTVPIIRRPLQTGRIPVPLPPSQEEATVKGRISLSIRVAQSVW